MQRNYLKLLEIMSDQVKTIENQSIMIASLVNENLEKENMINVLLKDIEDN